MRRFCHFLLLLVIALASAPLAQDNEQIADLSSKGARASRGTNGASLTGPSNAARPEIVSAFLSGRHDAATARGLVVESENPTPRGPIHLRLRQQLAGLEVYGTYVKATLTPTGELVSVVENLAPLTGPLVPAQVDYRDALHAVLERRYPGVSRDLPEVATADNMVTFAKGTRFAEAPSVTRVIVPMNGGGLRVGYLVETWDHANQLWHTVVNGNGRILFEQLRTASDRYNIFAISPGQSLQTPANGPGAGNAESPAGWLSSTMTIGNNVDAYLDRDNNNAADAGGRPVAANGEFLTVAQLGEAPTTSTNQMVAVTNLFYLNNVLHDRLYRHGFTEAVGNFQTNNFVNGGLGNDPVNAEAQDGGGTSNANFATPADGARPRMQMYLWTGSTPNRDGDLDSDIVYHEYGHGLTWRMIGSMTGPLAGAIGEGMSDTLSTYLNRSDVVGEYSVNNPAGIRRFPYTGYPYTYRRVAGTSVHNDGEIYAATMWKLLALWEGAGKTQDTLFDYIIDGMNYTPAQPAFEHMRDGILASSPTVEEDCLIWKAFAYFGIGDGASGSASCNFFGCQVSITESFSVPTVCGSGAPNTPPTVAITAPANGSIYAQGNIVTFTGTASDDGGVLTHALAWSSSLQGGIGTGGSFTRSDLVVGTHTITASATDSGGLTGSTSRSITVNGPITLTTRPYRVQGGQRRVDLMWNGATTANVDVYADGLRVATTPNDGLYTVTPPGKGGKGDTFRYKVCDAGTSACSAIVTAVF